MKKVILKKGHLNSLVEKMIKENTTSEGYDSPDRKAKFRSDVDDEMHKGFTMTMDGLGKMADEIGKLEIEKELHDELKKRLFMINKHLKPIADAMDQFQQDTETPEFSDPEDFDITDISPNE